MWLSTAAAVLLSTSSSTVNFSFESGNYKDPDAAEAVAEADVVDVAGRREKSERLVT